MIKVLFCGPIFNEIIEKEMPNASPATGHFLTNLCNELENIDYIDLRKAIYFSYQKMSKESILNIESQFVGSEIRSYFKNGFILSNILKFQEDILNAVQENTVVVFYNMFYGYWGLRRRIEKKGGKCILFFADHTPYMEELAIPNKIHGFFNEREIAKFQNIVSLVRSPNIKMNFKHFLHLNIGIKNESFKEFTISTQPKPVFYYAGTLSNVTGVDDLLNCISLLETENITFKLSGKGVLRENVINASHEDHRIEFLGFISEKDYYEELNKADVLLNPRNIKLKQNTNNFPSKIIEYLATGKIIISTPFDGYEDFVDNIIFYDGSIESLESTIKYVYSNLNQLKSFYFSKNREKSQQFEWSKQAYKMVSFFENILK